MPISASHVLQENIKTDQASVHKTVSKRENIKLIVEQKKAKNGRRREHSKKDKEFFLKIAL